MWVSTPTPFGDWFNLAIDDFLVPPPTWPSDVGILSDISGVPGANKIWQSVATVYDDFVANVTVASFGTVKLAQAWWQDISQLTDSFPGSLLMTYNPPQFTEYGAGEMVIMLPRRRSNMNARQMIL